MKLFLSICSLFVFFCITSNAQEYIQVKQSCAMCYGYGTITTMYGPAYCPNCHGSGVVIVTVPNPDYKPGSNGPSFKNKQPYAAECSHKSHECKLYIPVSKADSYCANCKRTGHNCLKSDHVKRYL